MVFGLLPVLPYPDNMKSFVLITGASSGIGYELAKLFAQDHYNMIMVARPTGELENVAAEIKKEYGIEVIPIAKDLFNPRAAEEIYQEVKAKGIQVDILVNDAGQGEYGLFAETDLDRELDIIQLNINSCISLTKFFLKGMIARGSGKVLNLSSIASKSPGPYQSVYHGTKAFIQSWSEALNNELQDTGVTVTALLPGATDTDFFNKADMLESKIVKEGELADAAAVAKDGYEALMAGKDMVISGFKNKAMLASNKLKSDSAKAESMRKQQEPSEEE